MMEYILSIDQGTTSTRAIVFNKQGEIVDTAQQEISCSYPENGWVLQDANEIWISTLAVINRVLLSERVNSQFIKAIGITNQRETTIVWDKHTGKPLHPAIVWQSRQSEKICERWKHEKLEPLIKAKTGLLIDPYFSASKIKWLMENVTGLAEKMHRGDVLFGTVDSYLVWKLTEGKAHITDVTNASRTLLFNIHENCWDQALLEVLNIPKSILPTVCETSEVYGYATALHTKKPIPIAAVCGDQQAALFGQVCFEKGMVKNTYGTGCFVLMNTGDTPVQSENGLLSTIAWRLNGETTYALEGSVFVGGSAIQWLRDGLRLFKHTSDCEAYALDVADSKGIYVVPTFVGLGTPYWDSEVRGGVVGLTRGSEKEHFIRATLEAIAYQSKDVIMAMQRDLKEPIQQLAVDGGASRNQFLMQFQSDILGVDVIRPAVNETTALGAAFLAGLAVGVYTDCEEISKLWTAKQQFTPQRDDVWRETLYGGWQKAVHVISQFK